MTQPSLETAPEATRRERCGWIGRRVKDKRHMPQLMLRDVLSASPTYTFGSSSMYTERRSQPERRVGIRCCDKVERVLEMTLLSHRTSSSLDHYVYVFNRHVGGVASVRRCISWWTTTHHTVSRNLLSVLANSSYFGWGLNVLFYAVFHTTYGSSS